MKQENRTPLNKSRDLTGQEKIYSQIKYWLGVVIVGLVVGLSIQFVVAWSEPTDNPPKGGGGSEAAGGITGGCQIYSGNSGSSAYYARTVAQWGKGCKESTGARMRVDGCGDAAVDGYDCGEIINFPKLFPEVFRGKPSGLSSLCLCVKK